MLLKIDVCYLLLMDRRKRPFCRAPERVNWLCRRKHPIGSVIRGR